MKCEYCGVEFVGGGWKYCSRECCRAADRDNKRISYIGKRKEVCDFCGKPLPKFKSRFCSNECKDIYNNIKRGSITHSDILAKTCIVCGKEFQTRKSKKLTCSTKCSQRAHALDNRIRGKVIDKDISLKKLSERDHNQCQICGLFVNWDDFEKTATTKICGNMYPSIDHIVPISLGGLHSWDNVQLAHRRCNSRKSNKYIG